jgi:RHS repeat-associated protein
MSSLDALVETDATGNNPTEYIFFGGKRIARRDPDGAVLYYFADHLGSSRVVTNVTCTIVAESDYYPFGGERIVVNNDPNPYKFTSKERDPESGLDYFVARYFGATLGRFLSPDPGGAGVHEPIPQTWNAYSYAGNNPLNAIDPDGLDYYLIGGDRCGKDIQCDKEGFVVDNEGNRIVITDQQVLSGAVKAQLGPGESIQITTSQGTFAGHFFDPNIGDDGRAIIPQAEVSAGLDPLLMALKDGVRQADVGVKAAMILTAPAFITAGGAQIALAGEAAIAETTMLPSTLNRLIGPFQRQLLRQFFQSRGASLPEGLSRESLKLYAEIAKRAIAEGKDVLGVQAERLKWITEALKRM